MGPCCLSAQVPFHAAATMCAAGDPAVGNQTLCYTQQQSTSSEPSCSQPTVQDCSSFSWQRRTPAALWRSA
jgi:hypothetical protein